MTVSLTMVRAARAAYPYASRYPVRTASVFSATPVVAKIYAEYAFMSVAVSKKVIKATLSKHSTAQQLTLLTSVAEWRCRGAKGRT